MKARDVPADGSADGGTMSEDQNDQSTGQPVEDSVEETAPTPVTEVTGTAIPLPSTTPSQLPDAAAKPRQSDTPPLGVPEGTAPLGAPEGTGPADAEAASGGPAATPPQGTYAMGALAGNPNLGAQEPVPGDPEAQGAAGSLHNPYPESPYPESPYPGSSHAGVPYGGVPYGGAPYGHAADPNAPLWPTPPAAGSNRDHRTRNALLAGAAAVAILAAGVGIGHAAWTSGQTSISSAPASGNGQAPSGNGSPFGGNGSPFGGNGSPFGGGFSGGSGSGGGTSSSSGGPSDVSAIASKIDPGLVDINTTLGYQQEQAAGTGIVISSNGVILTNNHVINGATSISVTDVGNQKTYAASVVGYDRTKDIAVLQLHNASGLQTASLGNSANAAVGQQVVGVGNAGGTGGTPSAAGGTITALNQSITATDQGDGTSEQLSGLIQTNADIQPGDSGGALVNTSGQVLGVDTAASAGFSFNTNGAGNQGFAIPINTALAVAHAIEAGSASSTVHIGQTAFLGVMIDASNSGGSGGSGNTGNSGNGFGGFGGLFGGNSGNSGSSPSVSGAAIANVVTNGPAQAAGLAQGDVITSLGGKTITSASDLTDAMATYHPGDKVSIGWTDTNGQTHTTTVQLSSGPPQ